MENRIRVKLDKERLLAETPILILLSIPYALSKKSPHLIFLNISNKENIPNIREYRKIAKIYKMLERIYLNDITILGKIADIIKERFISRLIHEYMLIYISRGVGLDALNEMASRVLSEIKNRVSRSLTLVLQWMELIVLVIAMFSLVAVLAGLGKDSSIPLIMLALITLFSFLAIPFIQIKYLDAYIGENTGSIEISLYIVSLFALGYGLYINNFYISTAAFIASLSCVSFSLRKALGLLRDMNNSLYTLQVLIELLSVSTASPRIVELLANDPRVPRPIINVLKRGSISSDIQPANRLTLLVSHIVSMIIVSGEEAVASIRLIYNVLSELSTVFRRIFMNGITQLALLTASIVITVLSFKYINIIFQSSAAYSAFFMPNASSQELNSLLRTIAITSTASSVAIAYAIFRRNLGINFAAPLILYITEILMNIIK